MCSTVHRTQVPTLKLQSHDTADFTLSVGVEVYLKPSTIRVRVQNRILQRINEWFKFY